MCLEVGGGESFGSCSVWGGLGVGGNYAYTKIFTQNWANETKSTSN